jgi:hypothetical protein
MAADLLKLLEGGALKSPSEVVQQEREEAESSPRGRRAPKSPRPKKQEQPPGSPTKRRRTAHDQGESELEGGVDAATAAQVPTRHACV